MSEIQQVCQPAMRVGGRRLSVTNRPKHPTHATEPNPPNPTTHEREQTDYPRPAPPGEQPEHEHVQHEEEQPKREKRKTADEHERRLQQAMQMRAEQNRPAREAHAAKNANIGARISQPSGRGVEL